VTFDLQTDTGVARVIFAVSSCVYNWNSGSCRLKSDKMSLLRVWHL